MTYEHHVICNQNTPSLPFTFTGIGEPKYLPVPSWESLNKTLEEALDSYNEINAVMNLVLFGDAMHHMYVICLCETELVDSLCRDGANTPMVYICTCSKLVNTYVWWPRGTILNSGF